MEQIFEHSFDMGSFKVYNDKPDFKKLISLQQTHSNIVLEFDPSETLSECDGVIFSKSQAKEYHFAIKTADCLPILLFGEEKVALLHAGWRGLANKIIASKKLAQIKPTVAFIGPSISARNFIVTKEFKDHFQNSSGFFEQKHQLTFNLQAEAMKQLNINFPGIYTINCAQCTFENLHYNSYRRDKTDKRNWNIFSI